MTQRQPNPEKSLWMREDQEQFKARWYYLAALAREYPNRFINFFTAQAIFNEVRKPPTGETPEDIRRAVGRMFAANEIDGRLGPIYLYRQSPSMLLPDEIFQNIQQWCDELRLVDESGNPLYWIGEHVAEILRYSEPNENLIECFITYCENRAEKIYRVDPEWIIRERNIKFTPFPKPFNLNFVPTVEKPIEARERLHAELDNYIDTVLEWYSSIGYAPKKNKSEPQKHYLWLAWQQIENMTYLEIANRQWNREDVAARDEQRKGDAKARAKNTVGVAISPLFVLVFASRTLGFSHNMEN